MLHKVIFCSYMCALLTIVAVDGNSVGNAKE
jgi:hypothetical protein